jgi:hypothetical protein
MLAGRPSKPSGAAGIRSLPLLFTAVGTYTFRETCWALWCFFSGSSQVSLFMLMRSSSILPLFATVLLASVSLPVAAQTSASKPEVPTTAPDRNQPCVHNPPLSRVPCKPVSVGFVMRHKSSLNGKFVTIRGKVVSAFLGDDACPPGRGVCMQPSVFLANSRSSDELQPQLRVLLTPDTPAHAYRRGAVVTVSGTVRATGTEVVLRTAE